MGKELVVTANRHETKVAVLEDDQLVEIYFQRANEYSLAGSIHKGRVTRVLPGMQSAFVDLGLERDTFLYVSDFFEENEEFEPVPSEEKSRRGGRGERPERQERPDRQDRPERSERQERADSPAPAAQPAPVVTAAAPLDRPVAPPPESRPAEGRSEEPGANDRDRRGRRSRRRRGRGRGFPDSKYASDSEPVRTESGAAETEVEAEVEPEVSEEIIVLPGESLAKYRRPATVEEAEAGDDDPMSAALEPAGEPDDALLAASAAVDEADSDSEDSQQDLDDAILERIEAAERGEEPEADTESPLEPEADTEAEPESVTEPDAEPESPSAQPLAAAAAAFESADDEEPEEDEPQPLAEAEAEREVLRLDPAGDLIEEQLLDAGILEAPASEESASGIDTEPEAGTELEAEPPALSDTDAEEPAAVEDSDAPEPARIPQSLTATLREQGGRYPHRTSRRMRRRRGGYDNRAAEAGAPAPAPSAPRQAEPPADSPSPVIREEPRTVARPEKTVAPVSITDLLKEGQEILVQIAKEPLGQKGARITSHIALPGRYVVYMPTVEHLGVSRKIGTDEERQRLKRILQTHRTGIPGGFIMRTAGEGKSEEEIAADMTYLFNLWLDIRQKAEKRTAPALIHHDLDIVQRILRDQFAENFKAIWVDNEDVYESILHFVQRFQPSLVGRIKMYTRPQPIFDSFNITSELEKALRPKVWLKSGGYIVINQTEALVAIDVNTGKYVGKSNRLEDTIVKTNTEAVKEIVRQVRLRDLGGIIVVDFIDMDERKNRQKVMQALEEAMRADKAPNKILQFNDFGLVAITRKRVKQSLERTLCAPCPYCEGAGYVKSVSTVVGEILQEAVKICAAVQENKDCLLRVNPEVGKYLKSTDNKYLEELEGILGRPVLIVTDARLHQEKFDLT